MAERSPEINQTGWKKPGKQSTAQDNAPGTLARAKDGDYSPFWLSQHCGNTSGGRHTRF